MELEFCLPLLLVGLTVLIFAVCWRFPGFRMLFDDSACALCLGPLKTGLWTAAYITALLYLPFALLGLVFGDVPGLGAGELLAQFGGPLLASLAFGVVVALARIWKVFSPRSYRQGLRRALRPTRKP